MRKNKLALLLLTAVLTMSFTACGAQESKTSESSADTEASSAEDTTDGSTIPTLKKGVLQVGVEIGYPPMEYFAEDGVTPTGFDIAVAKAIGEELGLEVEFVDTAWDGIFASLDTDKYDCIISSVSITPARQENYNLTEPYVANRLVLVTPQDSTLTSPEDVAGLTIAVQLETTADYYMQDIAASGVDFELAQYDKVLNCFDDLKAGRADAVFTDSVVASYYLGDDAASYKNAWENPEGEPIGICLKKGNDELTQIIEDAVDALYADGTMAEIAKEYFGSDITEGLR